jgi:hypothetical protein
MVRDAALAVKNLSLIEHECRLEDHRLMARTSGWRSFAPSPVPAALAGAEHLVSRGPVHHHRPALVRAGRRWIATSRGW